MMVGKVDECIGGLSKSNTVTKNMMDSHVTEKEVKNAIQSLKK